MSRGDWIRAIGARIFEARTMSRVVDPAIADLKAEPASAARYWAVAKVIVVCFPETASRVRVAAALSLVTAFGVIALLETPRVVAAVGEGVFDPAMLLYLIPQGLSFALTFALTVWVVSQFGGDTISRLAAGFVVAIAVAVSVVSFVLHGWVTPAANQAYRLAWGRHAGWQTPPTRGFPELTFGEVRERWSTAIANPGTLNEQDLHYLATSYEGRLAALVAPIEFAVFALLIAPWRRWARWSGAVVVCLADLGYLLSLSESNLMAIDRRWIGGVWIGGAAWYPMVALAVPIVVILFVTHFFTRSSFAQVSA